MACAIGRNSADTGLPGGFRKERACASPSRPNVRLASGLTRYATLIPCVLGNIRNCGLERGLSVGGFPIGTVMAVFIEYGATHGNVVRGRGQNVYGKSVGCRCLGVRVVASRG